ncbi:hypothetical protein POV27_05520 [Aureisphaera galaxeae]|uniref:hypothetical protein n=1 Tax=Aureisphaera galaxeae TaxID=1538023 RepID=UPI00234FFA88|nr:hypothetical protein [Aureisphaera galaxeae]MDC8003500.1 hypothetical protein [Aureisphaera galaxeae]
MNKLQFCLVLLAALFLFPQCEEPLEYKYKERPLNISCASVDNDLLREALYSFQDDMAKKYNDPDIILGTKSSYIHSYRQYIYRGMNGQAPYKEMASPYTLEILEKLKNVEGLWDMEREGSHLDYTGEFMSCIFENIKDEELRTRINSLVEVNYLTPKNVAEIMRQNVNKAFNDEYLAIYIALDGYYQYLLDIPTENE